MPTIAGGPTYRPVVRGSLSCRSGRHRRDDPLDTTTGILRGDRFRDQRPGLQQGHFLLPAGLALVRRGGRDHDHRPCYDDYALGADGLRILSKFGKAMAPAGISPRIEHPSLAPRNRVGRRGFVAAKRADLARLAAPGCGAGNASLYLDGHQPVSRPVSPRHQWTLHGRCGRLLRGHLFLDPGLRRYHGLLVCGRIYFGARGCYAAVPHLAGDQAVLLGSAVRALCDPLSRSGHCAAPTK